MRYLILSLFFALILSTKLFAQKVGDTIYYDADWKKTSDRDKAYYFRSIDKKEGDLFYITDHYSNGNPQMTGAYSLSEPEIKNGEFKFYNSQGQVTSIQTYKGDKLNGRYQTFHTDGTLSVDENYINDKLEGKCTCFDHEGKVTVIINYSNNKRNGKYEYFYPNGRVDFTVNYEDDQYEGKYLSYFETGQLRTDREYTKGKLNGLFLSYYPDGVKKRVDHFKNDNLTEGKCYTHSGADTAYFPFMVLPEIIGGEKAFDKYLHDNLKYPASAKENNITGRVYISFTVEPTGAPVDAVVMKSADPLLDAAALALVKTMPKWKPAIVDGQPEKLVYTIPINFTLSDK